MTVIRTLLLASILCLALQGKSQYTYYHDTLMSSSFSLLAAPVSVNGGQYWDDPEYAIPIGFNFRLFHHTSDTLHISQALGKGAVLSMDSVTATTPYATGIIAHGSDLADRDTSHLHSFSPISFSQTGSSPNRIFKLEWKNAGFFNAMDNGHYTDSMDMQLWLYETLDMVEIHFGNASYASSDLDLYDGGTGPLIGLFDSLDVNMQGSYYFLNDSVQHPYLDSFSNPSVFALPPGMKGNPQPGMVYRFAPAGENLSTGYVLTPSFKPYDFSYWMDTRELHVDLYEAGTYCLELYSAQGTCLKREQLNQGAHRYNMNDLPAGCYYARLLHEGQQVALPFIR